MQTYETCETAAEADEVCGRSPRKLSSRTVIAGVLCSNGCNTLVVFIDPLSETR